jgi:hypothetical protein
VNVHIAKAGKYGKAAGGRQEGGVKGGNGSGAAFGRKNGDLTAAILHPRSSSKKALPETARQNKPKRAQNGLYRLSYSAILPVSLYLLKDCILERIPRPAGLVNDSPACGSGFFPAPGES